MSLQTTLPGFEGGLLGRPVNVSSVPQRSPFRYPGGKTWLVPRLRQWLGSKSDRPALLVEPFAGGGVISLTAVAENLVDQVVMAELDSQVAAVWHTILGEDCSWLIERIGGFTPTFESVSEVLNDDPKNTRELAFRTIVKNRTSHGGVLAPGAGLLKKGENGKGISSRWYGNTIQKRIAAIHELRSRILFIEGDGFDVLESQGKFNTTVSFIDPPYTAPGKRAGSRLYAHWDIDHDRLFEIANERAHDFLMTYDNEPGAIELAKRHGFQTRQISMQNTHLATMNELLIGKDLTWAI
jgi:DNA adenine methylase